MVDVEKSVWTLPGMKEFIPLIQAFRMQRQEGQELQNELLSQKQGQQDG